MNKLKPIIQVFVDRPKATALLGLVLLLLVFRGLWAAGWFQDGELNAYWRTLAVTTDEQGEPYHLVQFVLEEKCVIEVVELERLDGSGGAESLVRVTGQSRLRDRFSLNGILKAVSGQRESFPESRVRAGETYRLSVEADGGRYASLEFTP